MYYTIYKVTNKLNNKIYIGKHKTSDINDSYMGSGLLIQRAIEKHGVENFTKEILHIFDNEEEMNDKEKEIVTESFVSDDSNYNLSLGGKGGWDPIKAKTAFKGKSHTNESKQKIGKASSGRIPWNKGLSGINHNTEESNRQRSKTLKGRPKSKEYKENHSIIMKEYYAKNPNSRGGLSNKGKKKPQISCPHCGKQGSPNNMKRWHFDNCSALV